MGGEAPSKEDYETTGNSFDLRFAADSGYDIALGYDVTVDKVVGDMDSIEPDRISRIESEKVVMFPREKDETDTEIGLRMLREAGCQDITIVGGGGGRLDHLVAILALFDRPQPPQRGLTRHNVVSLVEKKVVMRNRKGSTVSFFPVGHEMCTMHSVGLKWNLDGLVWKKGDVGLSNEITNRDAIVEIHSGRLIMVCSFDLFTGVSM